VGVLENHKYEAFAQALAKGMSAVDAYEEAGYQRHDGNASTLRAHPEVQLRVAELQTEAAKLTAVTIERITAELEEARQLALKSPTGASAAVAASLGKAKLHGLIVDRAKLDVETKRATVASMTDAELEAIIAAAGSAANRHPD